MRDWSGAEGGIAAVRCDDSRDELERFFDAAMSEVYPYLFRRCGHSTAIAEDLTQETFALAVRALRESRIEQLTVGWLIRCAQSRFIDHCRRESHRQRHLRLVENRPCIATEDIVTGDSVVTELLGQLPAAQRVAVVLHHLDDLTVPQIAERTGRSVRAVESLLARGRRNLRDTMGVQSDAT